VREPIEQCRGHLGISEHAAPLPERQVGGHDQRHAFVELADQMEQQGAAVLRERQVTELIEDDGIQIQQAPREPPGAPFALLGIELIDQVHDAVEAHALALLDCSPAERGGQVRLAGARAADQHDVARAGEVFAGVELADLHLVDRRLLEGEAIQVARHREARQAQLVLVGARPTLGDLSLQELPEPARRGELLLAQRPQALLQRAGHAPQAQDFHLFDQLGLHTHPPMSG